MNLSHVIPILAVSLLTPLQATTFFTEPFNYSDGDVTTSSSGVWVNHSGTGSFVQVASNAIVLTQGSGSREDINRATGATMGAGQVWTATFDVTVGGTADATNVYFAHFKDSGTGFNSRIFVAAPNVASGNFTFGLSETTSAPASTFATDFSFGTSYSLAVSYYFDTGVSELTIGGTTISSTSDPDIGQPMQAFGFRQAGGNTTQTIDNLVVSGVPEPSAALLGGLGLLGLIRRRR